MAKIKESKLTEVLKSKGLNDGFIHNLIKKIRKGQMNIKLDKNKSEIRDKMIDFYGSYDNIPDSVKKVIER